MQDEEIKMQNPEQPAPEEKEPEKRDEDFLSYRFGNLQGIGNRESQQDAFAFSDIFDAETVRNNGALAVVADGMGGLADGKLAADTGVSVLRQDFAHFNTETNIAEQLNDAMDHACSEVAKAVNGKCGCTAIAAVVFNNRLYYSSAGDSFIYLKRGELLTRLNRPHNILTDVLAELVSDGCMDPAEAVFYDKPVALSEFLGKYPLGKHDYLKRPLRLRYGDVVLICTDGVGGVLDEETIGSCLSADTPMAMCSALEEKIQAEQKRYQDNYTALIIQCVYK